MDISTVIFTFALKEGLHAPILGEPDETVEHTVSISTRLEQIRIFKISVPGGRLFAHTHPTPPPPINVLTLGILVKFATLQISLGTYFPFELPTL